MTPPQHAHVQPSSGPTASSLSPLPARTWPTWCAPAGILLLYALIHVALALRFPLAPDETYYWEWSRHLAWGYYDQGPMVAWWIRASCTVFGDTQVGVRAGIVLAALVAQALLYLLARDLLGRRAALLGLVLSGLSPLALAGGFIATYDPIVALFWAAASYFAARALLFGSRAAWVGVGVSFGLGLLSKHTMALFVPCLLIYMVGRRELRQWLRRAEPWLALALGVALFAPNAWWQAGNGWLTFRHLFMLAGGGSDQPAIRRIGDYVGSQAGLVTPLLFLAMVWALGWAWRRGRRHGDDRQWLLFSLSAPVLAVFLLMAVRTKVQANWAVCGWLTPPLVYAAFLTRPPAVSKARRAFGWAAIALGGLLSLAVATPEGRAAVGIHVPAKWDQMRKLYGGSELAAAMERERQAMRAAGHPPVVGAATYDTASRIAFYLPDRPPTYCFFLGTRTNSYVLWNGAAGLRPGGDALVADDLAPDDPQLPRFSDIFARVVPVGDPVVVRRPRIYGTPIRLYYLYCCYGYRPNPAVERAEGG